MGKPTWTIRLAIILLLASGAMFTQSPRIMAQTAETQCASSVPGSQAYGYADTGSVAISSGSESEATASAGSNQNDWVHAWMRKVDEARASQPHFVSPIVTTHVMLVQQYRFDMSWQQDPAGGTASRSGSFPAALSGTPIESTGWVWRFFVPDKVPGVFSARRPGRLLHRIFPWWFVPHGYSTERYQPHGLVSHLRSGQGHRPVGYSEHDRCESPCQRCKYSRSYDPLQHCG